MLSAETQASWESFIRATLTAQDVLVLHHRIPGRRGWCFGCLEWGRQTPWPCKSRLLAARTRAQEYAAAGDLAARNRLLAELGGD
ncbi:hypothetical protein [Longispora albida]|uniref:hypothetical protein n=1 Tax=Longispora albida TaxID=203523 RepID=UPI00036FB880|nr:hypothetical protein [Longispora albida]